MQAGDRIASMSVSDFVSGVAGQMIQRHLIFQA